MYILSIPVPLNVELSKERTDGVISIQIENAQEVIKNEVVYSEFGRCMGDKNISRIVSEYMYSVQRTIVKIELLETHNPIVFSRFLRNTIRILIQNPYPKTQQICTCDNIESHDPVSSYLLPWQYVASISMARWLINKGATVQDPEYQIYGHNVPFTRTGYIMPVGNKTKEEKVVIMQVATHLKNKLMFPCAYLIGPTGCGKTRPVITTMRTVLRSNITEKIPPMSTPTRIQLYHAAIVVVPSHTFTQWYNTLLLVWKGVRIRRLIDQQSLKSLYIDLVASRFLAFDVLLVSANVFTSNTVMRDILLGQKDTNIDGTALEAVEFGVTVIDEAHAYTQSFDKARTLPSDNMCYVSKHIATLRKLARGKWTILLSATPYLNKTHVLNQYLSLIRVRYDTGEEIMTTPVTDSGSTTRFIASYVDYYSIERMRSLFVRNCCYQTNVSSGVVTKQIRFEYISSRLVTARMKVPIRPKRTFLEECERIINKRDHIPSKYGHMASDDMQDECNGILGQVRGMDSDKDDQTINEIYVNDKIFPIGRVIIRVLMYLTEHTNNKILVYSEVRNLWPHVTDVLQQEYDIRLDYFGGNLHTINKKRKRFEDSTMKHVLVIPSNHIDGTDFPSCTHIVCIGKVHHSEKLIQVIGRGKRFGRTSVLTVVRIEPHVDEK